MLSELKTTPYEGTPVQIQGILRLSGLSGLFMIDSREIVSICIYVYMCKMGNIHT